MNKIKKFLHDVLRWGFPNGIRDKDQYGFQDTYNCKFCNGPLAQDSTGAWFHLDDHRHFYNEIYGSKQGGETITYAMSPEAVKKYSKQGGE